MFAFIGKIKQGFALAGKIRKVMDEGKDIPVAVENLKNAVDELYEEYDNVSEKAQAAIISSKEAYEEIKDVARAISEIF
jgi:ligand-binding sensor protein